VRGRLLIVVVLVASLAASPRSTDRPHYITVSFHDVVDRAADGDENAVTTDNLISFFEWLRSSGWTAITLDDIERARSGARPLPDRAVLITFDDGYKSLYTRVYPLLLAYRISVVAALVGSWMGEASRDTARRGDDLIPGSDRLISWNEAREMAKSGLVEFASHTYDMHRSHPANPQKGELPAAATRAYDTARGYESDASYRQRIRADVDRSRAQLKQQLGIAPRAMVWPFGRFTTAAREEALAADYRFLLTLDPEPGFLEDLPIVPRVLAVGNPHLPSILTRAFTGQPTALRMVRLNPRMLGGADGAGFENALGAAIERLRTMGATTVVVDAADRGEDGRLTAVWFPNRILPVRSDVLSRIVWQLRTRAGVTVVVSLPVSAARAAARNDDEVLRLFEDLGYSAPADALLLEGTPALASITLDRSDSASRWEVRRRRNSLNLSALPPADGLSLRAFLEFERVHPGNRLVLVTPTVGEAPSAIADLTLVEAPAATKPFREVVHRLAAAGWLTPERRYTSGVWIRGDMPPSAATLATNVRVFQRSGGVAFGWEQDDPLADEPKAALAAPAVSAAAFPLLRKP